ncbi:MAG: restriction endonuclease subunit S [Nitrosomonas sp.]|jgi:type I restriction enzyme S subunit|nr:restriction endonuclease subunit S [Nitrosomonas sp.]
MELKPGYKQTEVGVIPEDWDVVEIGEISKTSSGTTPARSQEERYFKKGEFHWIKTMDLNNSLIKDSEEKVTVLALKETCLQMYPIGTVLIAMYGGFNQIGRTGLLGINASVNQALVAIQLVREKVEPRFLLDTLNYRVEYWKSVASSSRKDPNITSNDVKHFSFPIPSTRAEQTAIANALSDADALIQSLTSFIAKKRQIKQGAMQNLLNPYENGQLKEGWVVKKLGEVGATYGGLSGKTKVDFGSGDARYIPFMNVMSNVIIDVEFLEKVIVGKSENQNKVRKGDLFFNGSSETPDELGLCAVLNDDIDNLYLNSFCFGFRLFNEKEVYATYLAYLFRSSYGRELLYSLAQGATRYNLSKMNFLKLEITMPSYSAQSEIARTISDIDAEIAAFEDKLAKYRHIKQGMMQNLLTGRIRLVQPDSKTGAVA